MRSNSSEFFQGADAGYIRGEDAAVHEYEERAYRIWKRDHCWDGWNFHYEDVLAEMLGVTSHDMVKEFDRRRCHELEEAERKRRTYARSIKRKQKEAEDGI